MRSPFYFIARPVDNKRYDNTREIDGVEFIINTSEEDARFSNRYAEVLELPLGYTGPVQQGDVLLVHHNVFKFYNDMKGRRKSGMSFFKEDLFFIENDQFFLFRHDGVWHTHDRYCFVKPLSVQESFIFKPITFEPLMGVMKYPNRMLLDAGVKAGDRVCYAPSQEYEFIVDGEKLYRMFDHQIIMVL